MTEPPSDQHDPNQPEAQVAQREQRAASTDAADTAATEDAVAPAQVATDPDPVSAQDAGPEPASVVTSTEPAFDEGGRAQETTGPAPASTSASGAVAPAGEPSGMVTQAVEPASGEPATAEALAALGQTLLAGISQQLIERAGAHEQALETLHADIAELTRLRVRDHELLDKLHAENTRLRAGEFATAITPLLNGLVRLHDQMRSLDEGNDPHSIAGILRTQLLQLLDTAAGVIPYTPQPGDRFDGIRHAGSGRTMTMEPAADGTVARTLKPGFTRGDGAVLRVAEVEVYRLDPAARPAG